MNKKILYKCLIILLMHSFAYAQDNTPPAAPVGFKGIGYELHLDLIWQPNAETDLASYKIYKWNSTNSAYELYASLPATKNFFSIWIGKAGLTYKFKISAVDKSNNESLLTGSVEVVTHQMTDEEFLDMVQRATFRYFWDYGDPNSGLARERWDGGVDLTNTIGGSGFGVMAILAGIERGFITRDQGAQRLLKILNFLTTQADRFKGAFPHWLNGTTGKVVKFGIQDGGDIVETSFLIQGLLTARKYFNRSDADEIQIVNLINQIWNEVDWNFYRNNSSTLIWNWSPTMGFNFSDAIKVEGWNETLITYLLAIASPKNSIAPNLYNTGWAKSGSILNGNTTYGYKIYVGSPFSGPLFFSHYSFLGFDPRGKKDSFGTNYFEHNKNAALVHREYSKRNVVGYVGYNENSWGLTSSYDIPGVYYSVHEPNKFDDGTIAPTAAISSMPYTPKESIEALKYFYRTFQNRLWGDYGFRDAFNLTYSSKSGNTWNRGEWFSDGYLAIDQGPIIVMIENYRTQLLWKYFMMNPEIQSALDRMGFVPDVTSVEQEKEIPVDFILKGNYPNPFNPETVISWQLAVSSFVTLKVYDMLGREVATLVNEFQQAGEYNSQFSIRNLPAGRQGWQLSSGVYFYRIQVGKNSATGKMVLQK